MSPLILKPNAIPNAIPDLTDKLQFRDSTTGKPKQCELSDLQPLFSSDPTPIIVNSINGAVNWVYQASNFTATKGTKYLIDNTSGARNVTFPTNPNVGDSITLILMTNNNIVNLLLGGLKYSGIALNPGIQTRFIETTLIYSGVTLGWITNQFNTLTLPARNIYNLLTYTPTQLETYNYWDVNNRLPQMNDGNLGNGVMKTSPTTQFRVLITFPSEVIVNRVIAYYGQNNGAFNIPTTTEYYLNNNTSGSPIVTTNNLTNTLNAQTLELTSNQNFNSPFSVMSIIFRHTSNTNQSINELQIFGVRLSDL